MAMHDPSMPNFLKTLSGRERKWLRHYLPAQIQGIGAPAIPPGNLQGALEEQSGSVSNLVSMIQQARQNMLVPDRHLSWISSGDHRLFIWLLAEMNFSYNPALDGITEILFPLLPVVPAEDRYERIVLTIDLSKASLDDKKAMLEQWKGVWAAEACANSEIDWLDHKDESQLRWAWEYLKKQEQAVVIPSPVTNAELYGAVVASLDRLAKTHLAVRERTLEKMRRTWAQRKYRASPKAKKQHYLPLTKETHKRLEWLAENWACKKSEVLEKLINQSYETSS